jgi:hypothetical protein
VVRLPNGVGESTAVTPENLGVLPNVTTSDLSGLLNFCR